MDEILKASVCQLAQWIKEGHYSSETIVARFIQRIEEINPQLNAVVFPRYKEALKEARWADQALKEGRDRGLLHGVPLTIKECLDLKNTPSTFGLIRRKNDFPKENDPYVQCLLDEGAIILGKTNVSQLLAYFESDNPLYGRTGNPLHPDFTCGGSSGGEGSIIAASGSPAGLGTDLGGSVRIPAAFCGILGLKSTMERNYDFSRIIENHIADSISSVTGILGRYIEDLDLLARITGKVSNPLNQIPQPFPDYRKLQIHEIRVGYFLSDGLFEPSNVIKDTVLESVRKLGEVGIMCKEIKPYRPQKAEELQTAINSFNGAELFLGNLKKDKPAKQIASLIPLMKLPSGMIKCIGFLAGIMGQKNISRLSRHFGYSGKEKWAYLKKERQTYSEIWQGIMQRERVNVILSPVNALPGYLHGSSITLGNGGTYTLMHNVTGFPAGTVAVGKIKQEKVEPRRISFDMSGNMARKIERNCDGLPLAVQVASLPWREDLVLKVMEILHDSFRQHE